MKLPAEQMSEASARTDVLTGPGAGGSRRGGATGIFAGSAMVVRRGLTEDAEATGAGVPGVGAVNWF
jgi:hypothetical protein